MNSMSRTHGEALFLVYVLQIEAKIASYNIVFSHFPIKIAKKWPIFTK